MILWVGISIHSHDTHSHFIMLPVIVYIMSQSLCLSLCLSASLCASLSLCLSLSVFCMPLCVFVSLCRSLYLLVPPSVSVSASVSHYVYFDITILLYLINYINYHNINIIVMYLYGETCHDWSLTTNPINHIWFLYCFFPLSLFLLPSSSFFYYILALPLPPSLSLSHRKVVSCSSVH